MIIVAILMAASVIPHILRMIKTGASRDQSIVGVCGIAVGIMCWIIYGLSVGDMTVVVSNLIMLAIQLSYAGTAIYYRIRGNVLQGSDDRTTPPVWDCSATGT